MDEQPIHAVSVAAMQEERFLLIRRARAPARGQFAFPGGRVERGESDEAAALRELREETGLAAEEIIPLCEMTVEGDNGRCYRLKVYRAHRVHGRAVAADDADHAGWYTIEEMRALPVTASTLAVAEKMAARLRK
ncbi:NUDIX hydrolase [Chelativorans intermedius]|uniref:NUDIX hydrolase n=1 Tax=Chelativorans intermedius TaxID=515947 RepID=A0ABV6D4N5_9HYPH|nr:NUDIX domain-containing protein [Chelativorans intermedius]MCT8998946.1 NUDIX domain-containing protein [Chelativorans intermedius]